MTLLPGPFNWLTMRGSVVNLSQLKNLILYLWAKRPMAAKILSSHPHPLTSLSLPSSNRDFFTHHHKPWLRPAWNPTRPKRLLLRVSLQDPHVLSSSSSALVEQLHHLYHHNPSSLILLADTASYSLASYYTSLGLFVISVPGLWSLIKRSVKSKVLSNFMIIFKF